MSMRDLAALFGDSDEWPTRDPAIEAEVLRDLAKAYLAPAAAFRIGDVVTWKDGLKNTKAPRYGQPMVVVEIVTSGVACGSVEHSFDGYYGHTPDTAVMFRDLGGDANTFGVDSRRIRLMTEDELRIVRAAA